MKNNLIIPKNYVNRLNEYETQIAIKKIKDFFQIEFSNNLNLLRVTAPIFLKSNSGLNDNLNGYEEPVNFNIDDEINLEIIHSLAKWKRYALHKYKFDVHTGLYTDMNAIRKTEDLDNIHSYYVDQWDWEKVINKEDINIEYLKNTVQQIYSSIKKLENFMIENYKINKMLPDEITFITTEQLLKKYPNNTPRERENLITKEHKAVFLMEIGDYLSNGKKHDDRSPDYDDWHLNGDILVYNPILDSCLELSSMGIRVTKDTLIDQLNKTNTIDRLNLYYHKNIVNETFPFTIGGGIGQSRLCMFFLQKPHIGQVQVSYWPNEMITELKKYNINLL